MHGLSSGIGGPTSPMQILLVVSTTTTGTRLAEQRVSKCYPERVDWVHTYDRQIPPQHSSLSVFGERTSKRSAASRYAYRQCSHLAKLSAPTVIVRDGIRPDVNIVAGTASIRLTDISSNLFQSAQLCKSDATPHLPLHIELTT